MVLSWFSLVLPSYSYGLPKTQRPTVTDGSLTETDRKIQRVAVTDGSLTETDGRLTDTHGSGDNGVSGGGPRSGGSWTFAGAGVLVCRCAGVPVCKCTGVPVIAVVYQYTGVPILPLI